MVKHKDGSWNRSTTNCNWLELKEIMYWVSRTQPTLQGHEILNTAGFRINGLRRLKSTDLESQRHSLLWSEDAKQGLFAGLCTCGKFELADIPMEKAKIQHQNHVRQAQRELVSPAFV